MASTTFILIDGKEKRVLPNMHYGYIDSLVASLSRDPKTIEEFDKTYEELTGNSLYTSGMPPIPQNMSLEDIRRFLMMEEQSEEEVVNKWESYKRGYEIHSPDEVTEKDIPPLDEKLIEGWKNLDPAEKEFYKSVVEYRRSVMVLGNDGIVVVDLRKKEIKYISKDDKVFQVNGTGTFINRSQGIDYVVSQTDYVLPTNWKIIKK